MTLQTTTKQLSKLKEICMQHTGKIKTVEPLEYRTSVQVSTLSLFYTVAHNCHGKIFFLRAKSFLSPQNHFGHSKIISAMAKSFSSRQNHFNHAKIILTTPKSFSSRQNHFNHGKIIFITAKSFSSRQNHFQPR